MKKIIITPNGTEEVNLTAEEIAQAETNDANFGFDVAMQDLRAKRDRLIAETDYLALSDNTLSEAMSTYRQALRDITNGITTVEQANSVTWPTKP
jgi:hypothetical protein